MVYKEIQAGTERPTPLSTQPIGDDAVIPKQGQLRGAPGTVFGPVLLSSADTDAV